MDKNIQLLDCTLRDGGQGLEDSYYGGYADEQYSDAVKNSIARQLVNANVDIIELGSIKPTEDDRRFACYQNIEDLASFMPQNIKGQLFAALYTGPDTDLSDIPDWNERLPQVVRVILRYSELQKSIDFCKGLSSKGYKVFMQPMLTMRYTPEEIQMLIRSANDMNAYALYLVDSYGYMKNDDVIKLAKTYDEGLLPSIRIGFHAHNNMNLAFSNVMAFLNSSLKHSVIVDSTLQGIGQGAGNLQTEIIANYLNENFQKSYKYEDVLEGCEIIDSISKDNLWGYSVTRLLPAINKTAYKYALSLRNNYKLSYVEIHRILSTISEELRHRYTIENTKLLLQNNGYKIED
ncbi:MAG: hypothetical protein PHX08_04785 [Lachnospiraceae bacterium]|nr:hypothetical protein [Lachnospiraceae bacterium]